jgi:hypothetical protein
VTGAPPADRVVPPTLMIRERVLTALAVIVSEPNARIVWLGELAEGDGVAEADWRGEYVREDPDSDAESTVELVGSLLGSSSSLVGWSVKWGAGSSSGDVQLVAELVAMDAGDEAHVVLMDRAASDVDRPFGCSCVREEVSLATVG